MIRNLELMLPVLLNGGAGWLVLTPLWWFHLTTLTSDTSCHHRTSLLDKHDGHHCSLCSILRYYTPLENETLLTPPLAVPTMFLENIWMARLFC